MHVSELWLPLLLLAFYLSYLPGTVAYNAHVERIIDQNNAERARKLMDIKLSLGLLNLYVKLPRRRFELWLEAPRLMLGLLHVYRTWNHCTKNIEFGEGNPDPLEYHVSERPVHDVSGPSSRI